MEEKLRTLPRATADPTLVEEGAKPNITFTLDSNCLSWKTPSTLDFCKKDGLCTLLLRLNQFNHNDLLLDVFYGLQTVDGNTKGSILDPKKISKLKELHKKSSDLWVQEYSPRCPNSARQELSRLELAKVMFNAYVDRSIAHDLAHAYGLVEFNSKVLCFLICSG